MSSPRESDDIAELATALLESSKEAFSLSDLPERAFISVGSPTADCGQLTVHVPVIRVVPQNKCASVYQVDFVINYFRCVTTLEHNGKIPASDKQQSEALELINQGWKLLYTLANKRYDGSLFGTFDIGCESVTIGDLTHSDPAGGIAGWQLTITLST